jgi:glycosyltransferase involved in cell wall biosynthesis
MQNNSRYSVAIFAHNLSSVINSCIKSVLLNPSDANLNLYIMANGCTDSTEEIIKSLQQEHPNIHLVSIPLADKANAWNYYVHKIAPDAALHFFIDGDIKVEPNALSTIAETMDMNPEIIAVGGVPVVGRDQPDLIDRMISLGRVSGGLYALRDSFLQFLRQNEVKIPIGFIGEDFLVSALVKDMMNFQGIYVPSPRLQIERQAGFSFRQLSPMRIGDYRSYFHRLVRYRIRDYQLSMLIKHVMASNTHSMPVSVELMYKNTPLLPQYYWRGKSTIIDWVAVFNIRKRAKEHTRNNFNN